MGPFRKSSGLAGVSELTSAPAVRCAHAVEEPPELAGRVRGPPFVRRIGRPLGLRVEQHAGELDRGYPVNHAVMCLADKAYAAVVEAVRDPHLPERALAAERRGQDGARELAQVGRACRPDVPVELEAVVVDPDGPSQSERHALETLPVAGRTV